MDLGVGALAADVFLDQQLVVGKGRHLRRVGDAQHLMPRRRLVQQLTDAPRRQTRYTGINFVVNDGGQRVAVRQGALERQHNAGKLAAGGNFCQRLGVLAGVGGDEKFHRVLPVGAKRPPAVLKGKADARHI